MYEQLCADCCGGSRPDRVARFDYVIVGGGNAAGYVCKELVAQGVGPGRVGLISAEPVVPYERPALTSSYLHPPGAACRARLPSFHTCVCGGGELQTPEWYAEKGISIVKGKATAVNLASKFVMVGVDQLSYDKLIIATGCCSARLSKFGATGDVLDNIFYLREEHEAANFVKTLEGFEGQKRKAVIVGGGYIGLECAAALVGWGIDTTMVCPGAHVMSRLFNPELAKWLENQYETRCINIVKGDAVVGFEGENSTATAVTLKSGKSLPCDVVVVGVGASPNVQWCEGLKMEAGGFAVNDQMQTSDPNVFAVGDVCAFKSRYGGISRCEHVDHARKSAAQAVKAALGANPEPYSYLPYFYSRTFEYTPNPVVFNFYGSQEGECQVLPLSDESIAAMWVKDGVVVGALLMGSPGPTPDDAQKIEQIAKKQPSVTDATAILRSVAK